MTTEEDVNRISLRVPSDLFRRLEDKRHAQRTTWQDLGLGLLAEWLDGEKTPGPPDDPAIDQLRKLLEVLDKDRVRLLKMLLQEFYNHYVKRADSAR
jgi:hypothetical protein